MDKLKFIIPKKKRLFSIFLILVLVFFIFNFKNLNYGLPFFFNADEIAHLKSVLYFYGFLTNANQNIVEPIYAPLINFLISGFFIFLHNLFNLNLSLSNLEGYFFLNPDRLIYFLRLSSLIVSCFTFFVIYLIFKKLKINIYIFVLLISSILFSPFLLDISLIAGKNSILAFIFILQFYYFLKYFIKIEKFKFQSYIIFSILGCIAWGVNYWCASPSLYAIGFLHFYKYKFKKLNYLLTFFILFSLFGIILNSYLTLDNPLKHLFSDELFKNQNYYVNSSKLNVFIEDIKNTINIFYTYEKFLLILLFISIFFVKDLNKQNRVIYTSILFLSIEPAILFAIADYSYPQLRYFGPSIIFAHLNLAIILNTIKKKQLYQNKIYFIILFGMLLLMAESMINKFSIHKNYIRLIQKEYLQYEALQNISINKEKTLIFIPAIYRENLKNLEFYDDLINSNADSKNSFKQRKFKRNKLLKLSKKKMFPNSGGYIFFGGEFLINNFEDFLNFSKKKFDYILIDDGYIEFGDILSKKHITIKKFNNSNISAPRTYLRNIKEIEKKITQLGPNMTLYKINN